VIEIAYNISEALKYTNIHKNHLEPKRLMYRVTSCPEGLTQYYTHEPEGECV
jgi:hypothetical protein